MDSGLPAPRAEAGPSMCPLLDWAESGLMLLTGRADAPLLAPAAPVYRRLAEILTSGAGPDLAGRIDLRAVLSGRAHAAGFTRHGSISANGSCRLVPAADGWLALNLARDSDIESLAAFVGAELGPDKLATAMSAIASMPLVELVERAELLGVPFSALPDPGTATRSGWQSRERAAVLPVERGLSVSGGPVSSLRGLRVVSLASLWAGPLVARLLSEDGAEVLSVESVSRPDPSRHTQPAFYRWLHDGQQLRTYDFAAAADRAELASLISGADVVIEGSRPRALRQLGLGADDLKPARGQTWLSITGHGRQSARIAFGDDAAVAGGLVARDESGPVFCGDAIADPIAGVFGYSAVRRAISAGGGQLLDLSMSAAAAELARPAQADPDCGHDHKVTYSANRRTWQARCGERTVQVQPPVPLEAPRKSGRQSHLGDGR